MLICNKRITSIQKPNYLRYQLATMDNCNKVPRVPFDPGWNDPPTLSYNPQQSTTPNKPRLNKRVAFPLSGGAPNPAPPPPVNMPPIPPGGTQHVPLHTTLKPPSSSNSEDINIDSESTLVEVKGILLKFLEDSSELGPKANDIKRRIGVMEDMWHSGKLNKAVHARMQELAVALQNDETIKADEIHRALMVDHVSAVGTWMPGIKQLIHHCTARSELLSIDKE